MHRRHYLRMTGGVMTATLAGCVGDSDDDGADDGDTEDTDRPTPPDYADWLANGAFVKLDFERIGEGAAYQSVIDAALALGTDAREPLSHVTDGEMGGLGEIVPVMAASSHWLLRLWAEWIVPDSYPLMDVEYAGITAPELDADDPVATVESLLTLADGMTVRQGDVDESRIIGADAVTERTTYEGFTIYEAELYEGFPRELIATDGETIIEPGITEVQEVTTDADAAAYESDQEARIEATVDASAAVEGGDDLAWLTGHAGDGAFVLGASGGLSSAVHQQMTWEVSTDPDRTQTDEEDPFADLEVDDDRLETLQTAIDPAIEGAVMVADDHPDGRITRSSFAFESSDEMSPEESLVDAIAGEAASTEVETDGPRISIEATWE